MESLHNAIIEEDGTILDKYDQEILDIVKYKNISTAIEVHWNTPYKFNGLFAHCSHSRHCTRNSDMRCGCLTQVHSNPNKNVLNADFTINKRLTEELRLDPRIHDSHYEISDALLKCETEEEKIAILQPYAEWQRRLDIEIRGKQ